LKAFPPASGFTTRTDVESHLNQYPKVAPGLSYYLTSSEWSIEPLEYRFSDNNPHLGPHWYVNARYGGPSIQFIPRYGYPWHQKPHQLITGVFSDYPYYYSASDHRQINKRPAALVSTMKAISKRLRSQGTILRSTDGQRAIALSNALTVQANGVVMRQGDIIYLSPPPNKRLERTRR
jgi:hypothetical protein